MLAVSFPCGLGLYPAPVGLGPFGHIWNQPPFPFVVVRKEKRLMPVDMVRDPFNTTFMEWMPEELRVAYPATILCNVCEILKAPQHHCPPGWLLGWSGASVETPASFPEIWKIATSVNIWLPFVREMLKLARGLLLVDHVSLKKYSLTCSYNEVFSMFSLLQE